VRWLMTGPRQDSMTLRPRTFRARLMLTFESE
jgi:hypothetical protein